MSTWLSIINILPLSSLMSPSRPWRMPEIFCNITQIILFCLTPNWWPHAWSLNLGLLPHSSKCWSGLCIGGLLIMVMLCQLEGNHLWCWLHFGLMFVGWSLLGGLWLCISRVATVFLEVSGFVFQGWGGFLYGVHWPKAFFQAVEFRVDSVWRVDTCSVSWVIVVSCDITIWESNRVPCVLNFWTKVSAIL